MPSMMLVHSGSVVGLPRQQSVRSKPSRLSCQSTTPEPTARPISHPRRNVLILTTLLSACGVQRSQAAEATAEELEETVGTGTRGAQRGDLVMLHYVATLSDGTVFDSTRGGLRYRDAGEGVSRPLILRVGGDPVPGVCVGLAQGILGMTIGGRRRITVSPDKGFGSVAVGAPFAVVPPSSTLVYDVELLRLSTIGPDALTRGIAFCGAGGGAQQAAGCGTVSIGEYLYKPLVR